MIRAIKDRLIIEPYFDADKIGSIYIPESFKNPEAQQGEVVAAGPDSFWAPLDYLVFHPFRSEKVQGTNYISIRDTDVVALLDRECGVLIPKIGDVMIRPDWHSKYGQKGLIYLPPAVVDAERQPVLFGTIVDYRSITANVSIGERVVFAPGKGSEAALDNDLYYFIPSDEILAVIPSPDSDAPGT